MAPVSGNAQIKTGCDCDVCAERKERRQTDVPCLVSCWLLTCRMSAVREQERSKERRGSFPRSPPYAPGHKETRCNIRRSPGALGCRDFAARTRVRKSGDLNSPTEHVSQICLPRSAAPPHGFCGVAARATALRTKNWPKFFERTILLVRLEVVRGFHLQK